jgi:hypothetical protein
VHSSTLWTTLVGMHSDGLKRFVSLNCLFPQSHATQESVHYRTLPSENVAPMGESYNGRLPPPPPPLPPKDHPYTPPNYDRLESQPSQSTISTSQLTHMTAVERSNALRVARTEPYLQVSPLLIHRASSLTSPISQVYVRTFIEVGSWFVVVNILLTVKTRYDTIDEHGIWRGAAMIVSP